MSDGDDAAYIDTRKLDGLIAALKESGAFGRIGILGNKSQRSGQDDTKGPKRKFAAGSKRPAINFKAAAASGDGLNNATIGALHEYGSSTLPMRSFLRMPLAKMLPREVENAGLLDVNTVNEVIATKSVVPWLTKLMILCEGIVADAFDTGGFGEWKPSVMTAKKTKQTLVETHQLRDSITSEVKGG